MKICTYCKSQYDDSEVMCRTCGNKLVDAESNQGYAPTGYNQAPQNPQPQYQPQPQVQAQPYQQAPQQPYQAPVTPPAKKGGIQWWHILLIVLAVLIIGGLIAGIVAVSVFGNKIDAPVEDVYEEVEDVDDDEDGEMVTSEAVDTDEEEEVVDETTTEAPVENLSTYSKGEFINGEYSNEWANFRMDFTGWTEGTADDYATYTVEGKSDCLLVVMDYETMTQVVLVAEHLYGLNNIYTAEEYVDLSISQIAAVYDEYNIGYTIYDAYTTELAGKTYDGNDISTNTGICTEIISVKIDNTIFSMIIINNAGEWGSNNLPDFSEY